MKLLNIIALCAFFLYVGVVSPQAGQQLFFETLYDVPIMPGLEEAPEMGMSFDKVEGRLARGVAVSGQVEDGAVLKFYGEVLPQMGWQKTTPYIFVREKEKLEISFEKTNAYKVSKEETGTLVKFILSPVTRTGK